MLVFIPAKRRVVYDQNNYSQSSYLYKSKSLLILDVIVDLDKSKPIILIVDHSRVVFDSCSRFLVDDDISFRLVEIKIFNLLILTITVRNYIQ